jgi:hypothetical protein
MLHGDISDHATALLLGAGVDGDVGCKMGAEARLVAKSPSSRALTMAQEQHAIARNHAWPQNSAIP